MLPVLLVLTGVSVAWSYFYMPCNPTTKTPILGVSHPWPLPPRPSKESCTGILPRQEDP